MISTGAVLGGLATCLGTATPRTSPPTATPVRTSARHREHFSDAARWRRRQAGRPTLQRFLAEHTGVLASAAAARASSTPEWPPAQPAWPAAW